MDSTQRVVPGRKGCAIGNYPVGHRNALAAEGMYCHAKSFFESKRPANVVRMSMSDEDTANSAPLRALLYDGVEISNVINRWIDDRGTLGPAAKNNGICAWPRHH